MAETAPQPTVMPVDREAWRKEIHLANFVNAGYQYRDLQSCGNDIRKVLIIGPGQGLDTHVLRWLGYDVTTFDIDETFNPDHIGSVHEMTRFADKQFDAVIASHVLEHLPVPYLDTSIAEIARVGRYALIYLPVAGRHLHFRFIPGVQLLDFSFHFDYFNWFHKPDGITPRYMAGQHFWEIGMRGFRLKDITQRLERKFEVVKSYRNHDWLPSHNFVLKSR